MYEPDYFPSRLRFPEIGRHFTNIIEQYSSSAIQQLHMIPQTIVTSLAHWKALDLSRASPPPTIPRQKVSNFSDRHILAVYLSISRFS